MKIAGELAPLAVRGDQGVVQKLLALRGELRLPLGGMLGLLPPMAGPLAGQAGEAHLERHQHQATARTAPPIQGRRAPSSWWRGGRRRLPPPVAP